jgi:hypothetical protein
VIFCTISIFLLDSLVAGRNPSVILMHSSRECTPPYLSTGISNLLQPAQAEVVLGPALYVFSLLVHNHHPSVTGPELEFVNISWGWEDTFLLENIFSYPYLNFQDS